MKGDEGGWRDGGMGGWGRKGMERWEMGEEYDDGREGMGDMRMEEAEKRKSVEMLNGC